VERIQLRLERILKRRAIGKTDLGKLLQSQDRYYNSKASDAEDFYDRRLKSEKIDRELRAGYLKVALILDRLVRPKKKVLDLACGIGYWSCLVAKKGARVTSVDQSAEVLRRTRRRALENRVSVKTIRASVLKPLPLENEGFNGVLMTWLIAHVPRTAAPALLREVHRVSKPGAWLLISDSRWRGQPGGKEQLQIREAAGKRFPVYKYYYTPAELRGLLRKTGWTEKLVETSKYELFAVAIKNKK